MLQKGNGEGNYPPGDNARKEIGEECFFSEERKKTEVLGLADSGKALGCEGVKR